MALHIELGSGDDVLSPLFNETLPQETTHKVEDTEMVHDHLIQIGEEESQIPPHEINKMAYLHRDDVLSPLFNETLPQETTHKVEDTEMVHDHLIQIGEEESQIPPHEINKMAYLHRDDEEIFVAEPCIFRVHDGLRSSNPSAYTPMLISIGPYHRKNKKCKPMEKHKSRYLQSFLSRAEHSQESYKEVLKGLQTKARECYADPIDLKDDEEFLEMLLVDGSFVVEFVRKCSESGPKARDDPVFNVEWVHFQVCRDLLLLENQLPFFVLSKLYEMTKDPNTKISFREMVKWSFASMLPKLCPKSISVEQDDSREIKHLLHVVHIFCEPLGDEGSSDGKTMKDSSSEYPDQIRSVTELQEAGVSFKKAGKLYASLDGWNETDRVSLFDIKFDNGEFTIPSFNIDDSTESFFRNFIAYEQHTLDVYPKYFSDYASVMDQLINSRNDVSILRLEGIIMNLLGHDKVVAVLFNKLCQGVVNSPGRFYYSRECKKVNEYCQRPWNLLMAKLRHDYFNSPWAGISTAAAIVLLLLTVAQTVATFVNF